VRSISNTLTIGADFDLASPGLVEYAVEQGADLRLARLAGTRAGIFAVRVEGSAGIARWVLRASRGSFLLALGPATIAVRRLAAGDREPRGLVPADRQVTTDALFAYLDRHGIAVTRDQPSL